MLSESNTSSHTTVVETPILPGIHGKEKQHEDIFSDIDFSKGCDVCKEASENNNATAFCKDCRQVICSACLDRHSKCNSTKQHTIIGKQELLNQDKDASSLDHTSDEYKSIRQMNLTETYHKDSAQFCDLCDDYRENLYINEAFVLCERCDKKMCYPCLCIHHGDTLKREHPITPLKWRADTFLRKLKCNSHPDSCTSITFFCLRHREIICFICKLKTDMTDVRMISRT